MHTLDPLSYIAMNAPKKYRQTIRLDLLLNKHKSADPQSPDVTASPTPDPANPKNEFDQLLDTLYDAAILTDHTGNLVTANHRALDFFQCSTDNLLQKNIAQLIAGANESILATVLQNISENRFTLMQAYCIRCDQSSFPAEISVTAVARCGQQCLCFSIRDITVRREVEERLRIEGEAIRNAGDGIVISDTDGYITYANPAVAQLWDLPDQEDLIGQNISELFPLKDGIAKAIQSAVETGSWNGELDAAKSNTKPLFLQTDITASLDEHKCITHLVFSFADITRRRQGELALIEYQNHLEDLIRERTTDLESTNRELRREVEERRQIEEKLRQAIHQLREHDKAKSIFVSNVSHELRTPLTSLINSLENLMRGVVGPISNPVHGYFNMMLEDCWRLERTINDILDLSRIEKGTFQLVRHPIPFSQLVRRTSEAIRISAEAIHLQYDVCQSPCHGFVDGDAAKIERAITNVISNALKFTPAGGTIRIACSAILQNQQPALTCEIIDSGLGIPAHLIDRVTERFFRVGEQVEGTGLGLAITREIAEKHGGGIEILSPPPGQSQGTCVRLWFPRCPPPAVLVVLPATPTAQALCNELKQREYTVDGTSHGTEAVQKLRNDPFSFAMIGAELADITGTETIMHIMADAAIRNTVIIYLSEKPLDETKTGLLQGFQIPFLPLSNEVTRIVDSWEESFLPAARARTEYAFLPHDTDNNNT